MALWRPDEAELYGWRPVPGDKYVCANCFDDYAVKEFIESSACAAMCSYCGKSSADGENIAADIDDVVELIAESLSHEWSHPAEELPYEYREGGYQGEVRDTMDVLEEVGLGAEPDELVNDIYCALWNDHWCRRHYFSLGRGVALAYAWERFAEAVKHRTRHMFFDEPTEEGGFRHPDDIPPSEVLVRIAEFVIEVGLTAEVPPGTAYYRARVHKECVTLATAAELGPPPVEFAVYSNRMSPAGISMFYGACDPDTAIAETFDPERAAGYVATVALWRTTRGLNVLDLRNASVPSLFDTTRRHLRQPLLFLRDFIDDLARPIVKDGREHIDYVPTQIVTEYFRHRFRTEAGEPVHGILYRSARRNRGVCCVLFCDQQNCIEPKPDPYGLGGPERWLTMDASSVRRANLPDNGTDGQERSGDGC